LGRVSPQPFLVPEQHAKGTGDLPMMIALVSRRKCPCKAQRIAPHLHKLVQAVEAFDKRFTLVGHGIGLAPFALQRRVKSRSRQRRSPHHYVCRAIACCTSGTRRRGIRSQTVPPRSLKEACEAAGTSGNAAAQWRKDQVGLRTDIQAQRFPSIGRERYRTLSHRSLRMGR
jgi:hypothetical protein